MKKLNLTGMRFGELTVIKECEPYDGRTMWLCQCSCGNQAIVRCDHLKNGTTKGCGCLSKARNSESTTELYNHWARMRARCGNVNDPSYSNYGGRGIAVCEEWENSYENYKIWALSNGYKDGLTLDRINNDKDYSPGNCRWATWLEQANNRRNNRVIEINNKSHTIAEWSRLSNISPSTIWKRVNSGWPKERLLEKPQPRKLRAGR